MDIAADNVLHVFSATDRHYFHIRSFKNGTVNTHECDPGHPIKVSVQQGHVIAVNRKDKCPLFFKETIDCTGLLEKKRLERVKSFFYLAKENWVYFLAIVESDASKGKTEPFFEALKGCGTKAEEVDGSNREKHGTKRARNELGSQHSSRRRRRDHGEQKDVGLGLQES